MGRYESYFKQYDLDIRKSNNGRWLDQKCTYDVISIIADSILEYTNSSLDIEFTVNDIWQSDYAHPDFIVGTWSQQGGENHITFESNGKYNKLIKSKRQFISSDGEWGQKGLYIYLIRYNHVVDSLEMLSDRQIQDSKGNNYTR